MNVVLNPELEELIQSQLDTGKYENVEAVVREALRLLSERNNRNMVARKVKNLFDKTQTGDRDFTEVETLGNTRIVSVSGFVDRILGEGQD
ncbi:MAG: type II toxin-antitoxin system ParD family antitoxin [Microcoleus sp. SU_5_3]|nr:type II toxin-antitoxin system ParD family antitoxin [Microcoleus sp. SU_5_3]NJL67046.1 type II toxin-antitoxin system ParD family antitoxin [Microcoleus sp. SM1_3_4]